MRSLSARFLTLDISETMAPPPSDIPRAMSQCDKMRCEYGYDDPGNAIARDPILRCSACENASY